MKKLPKYRIERRRAYGWVPVHGGRAIARHRRDYTSLHMRLPRMAVLTADQVLFAGSLWRVLSVHKGARLLELRIARIGGVRLV